MSTHRLHTIIIAMLLAIGNIYAQTPLEHPSLSIPSKIAPKYFGPNAFPVPEMLDGRTSDVWDVNLSWDSYIGTTPNCNEDYTTCAFVKLTIPLFSPRVNFVLWGNLYEYYRCGEAINNYRRVKHDGTMTGSVTGDIYVSTNFMILMQEQHHIDLAIRAALKTASGDDYERARYYDSPGYFFDATLGREIKLPSSDVRFKVAASGGFLCWQTDNGRQNDAVMYGVKLSMSTKKLYLSAEYSGYVGWENDGDAPMTLKANASWSFNQFAINAGYQVGFVDWPFHKFSIGASYRFSL